MDLQIPEDYMTQVMAESEDMALNNIDAGTTISTEMSNAAPQKLMLAAAAAARRRKQQQDTTQDGSGMMFGQKRRHSSGGGGGVVSGTGDETAGCLRQRWRR